MKCAGVALDCIFPEGGEIGVGSIALECRLGAPVYAAPGAILRGLHGVTARVEVPAGTVVHGLTVTTERGDPAYVVRAYGVADDPKASLTSGAAAWFGQPILRSPPASGFAVPRPGRAPGLFPLYSAAFRAYNPVILDGG